MVDYLSSSPTGLDIRCPPNRGQVHPRTRRHLPLARLHRPRHQVPTRPPHRIPPRRAHQPRQSSQPLPTPPQHQNRPQNPLHPRPHHRHHRLAPPRRHLPTRPPHRTTSDLPSPLEPHLGPIPRTTTTKNTEKGGLGSRPEPAVCDQENGRAGFSHAVFLLRDDVGRRPRSLDLNR